MRSPFHRVDDEPIITSESIDASAGSSDPRVVLTTLSPGRPTSVTTAAGVEGARCLEKIAMASDSWELRRCERGLYKDTTKSPSAADSNRRAIVAHGVSRSDNEIDA
jgi:hypothetical protein